MHIAYGIWERSDQQYGGTGKCTRLIFSMLHCGAKVQTETAYSFLVKDALQDMAGSSRLKA